MGGKVDEEVIEDGLLVYCLNTTEAAKIAGLKNKAGAPAIQFYKDGQYQSTIDDASITQVKISHHGQDHYFKRVAVSSGDDADSFAASAWIEVGADGKMIDGKSNLHLCYNGYTGDMPPSASDPKAKSALAVMRGEMNPQNKQVNGFVEKALAAATQEGEIIHYENYGHSTGASNAALSNAKLDTKFPGASEAVLVEPFKIQQSIQMMVKNQQDLGLEKPITADALVKNTHSRMAARKNADGKLIRFPLAAYFLGDGVGEQALVNMGPDAGSGLPQAFIDHQAKSIALASENGTATTIPAGQGHSGNTIQDWIIGLLSSLLSELFGVSPSRASSQQQPPSTTSTTAATVAGQNVPSLAATGVTLTDPAISSAAALNGSTSSTAKTQGRTSSPK